MSDFHRTFTQSTQALHDQIDALAAPDQSLPERKAKTDAALASITKLAASLADASGNLPAYDQRSYHQSIRQLQDKLALTQASHAPKPKFSFKNKRLATPASEATSAATSRSVTPNHLQDTAEQGGISQPTPAHALPAQPQVQNDPVTDLGNANAIHISNLSGVFKRLPDEAANETSQPDLSCTISDVASSIVYMQLSDAAGLPLLTINNATESLIVAPCVKGPAWISGARATTLVLSCHQFRMHDSHNVNVYLHCSSRPIIEDCTGIKFFTIPSIFQTAEMTQRPNLYDQVDDFKWLRAEHSPNWSLGDNAIGDAKWKTLEGEKSQESAGLLGDFLPS